MNTTRHSPKCLCRNKMVRFCVYLQAPVDDQYPSANSVHVYESGNDVWSLFYLACPVLAPSSVLLYQDLVTCLLTPNVLT